MADCRDHSSGGYDRVVTVLTPNLHKGTVQIVSQSPGYIAGFVTAPAARKHRDG